MTIFSAPSRAGRFARQVEPCRTFAHRRWVPIIRCPQINSAKFMNQATNTGKLTDSFKNVLSKTVQGNRQLFNRISTLAADAAKELSADAQSRKLPSATETFNRLAELNLAYWSALADNSLAFANEMAGATERALGLKPCASAKTELRVDQIEISLTAHPGEPAVAGFQVENSFSNSLEVSFQASDLISADGVPLKTAPVTFKPPRLTIAPNTQAVIQATIDVPPECKPGQTYTLGVKPVGFPTKEFSIRLNVVAPPAKSRAKPSASPTKGAGRKKRKKSGG